jgi:hypothetical protein
MAPPKSATESHAITTPIYQPPQPPPPPHSSSSSGSLKQQPSTQMPFGDPFRGRQADPFMPNQQQQQHSPQQQRRRGSYGYHGSGPGRDTTAGAQQSRDGAPSGSWPGKDHDPPIVRRVSVFSYRFLIGSGCLQILTN